MAAERHTVVDRWKSQEVAASKVQALEPDFGHRYRLDSLMKADNPAKA
jgi:hypothetical protein